jgi:hypothetical protein
MEPNSPWNCYNFKGYFSNQMVKITIGINNLPMKINPQNVILTLLHLDVMHHLRWFVLFGVRVCVYNDSCRCQYGST